MSADKPKADAPKTDAPKSDAPKSEAPKGDAPKADAQKADAQKADAQKADAQKADVQKADAPKAAAASPAKAEPGKAATKPPERVEKDGIVRIENRSKGKLVEPSLDAVDALDCDSLVLHLTADLRPLAGLASYVDWRLCGRLSELVQRDVITGRRGEHVLLPTNGRIRPVRIFVFGWGSHKNMLEGATDILKTSIDVITKARAERVAVALPEPASRVIGLVDEHIVKPLGDRLFCVFAPDGLLGEAKKDTRPIPAPVSAG
jgi:hypothetical protein